MLTYQLVLVVLVCGVRSAWGLSCACNPRKCPVATGCAYGTGLDPCFCCTVCNLGPGDTCGGPFDVAGRCGDGLTCVKLRPGDLNLQGVCREGPGGNLVPHQPEQLNAPQLPLGAPQQPLGAPQQPLSSDPFKPIHFPLEHF